MIYIVAELGEMGQDEHFNDSGN